MTKNISRPWYKRFPKDFIDGTIGLNLEEKGAYSLILDLIYLRGGPIQDDSRYICGVLGCSSRKWTAIRTVLLDKKKITIEGGEIHNSRARNLLETSSKLRDNFTKPRDNFIENEPESSKNSILTSNPSRAGEETETDTDIETESIDHPYPPEEGSVGELFSDPISAPPRSQRQAQTNPRAVGTNPRAKTAGTRYVETDEVPEEWEKYSRQQLGWHDEKIISVFEQFNDYWLAATGPRALKADWLATWRSWCRRQDTPQPGAAILRQPSLAERLAPRGKH